MLDYEELPESYGTDDVTVMAQSPSWLFVYWEVTADGRAGAYSRLGADAPGARLVLRLSSVGVDGGALEKSERDIELDRDHGRRYVEAPRAGVRVTVAVGLRAPSGSFAPIAHAGPILVPPAEPGPEGPVEWMEVAPARRRGAEREPIVVVARGKERLVRGVPAEWDAGAWRHPGSRVPPPPPPGPEQPFLRLPGSSWHKPQGEK